MNKLKDTVVSQKSAHGQSTLQVHQRGGWALFQGWALFHKTTVNFLCYSAVGVVGFEQPTYTFEEDAGTVDVCMGFLQPKEIDSTIIIDLLGSTTDGTTAGESNFIRSIEESGYAL